MLLRCGMKHHAALRKLVRNWIRILFRVWQTGIPFDCDCNHTISFFIIHRPGVLAIVCCEARAACRDPESRRSRSWGGP